MKRLLITGGSGFVGGHLLGQARKDWEVHATYESRPFQFSSVTTIPLSLGNPYQIGRVLEQIRPHVLIHAAAKGDLELCEKDPAAAFRINAEATRILSRLCAAHSCRLVYVSTDMVFDGREGNYSESGPANPINVYGRSKLDGEMQVLSECPQAAVARSALIYGKPVTGSNSFSEKILVQVYSGKTCPLYTDQIRSPILVDDLACALLELAGNDFQGIIHLGGRDSVVRFTFGTALAEVAHFEKSLLKPVRMDDVPTEAPRPRDSSLDTGMARSVLKTRLRGYSEGLAAVYGSALL